MNLYLTALSDTEPGQTTRPADLASLSVALPAVPGPHRNASLAEKHISPAAQQDYLHMFPQPKRAKEQYTLFSKPKKSNFSASNW